MEAYLKEKRALDLAAHLKRLDTEIERVTKLVLDGLFADNLKEAYQVMDRMRGEEHVRNLRDERHELEFYAKRRAELEVELEQLTKTSEVANG